MEHIWKSHNGEQDTEPQGYKSGFGGQGKEGRKGTQASREKREGARKEGAGPFDVNAHGNADPLGDVPGGQCVIWEHGNALNGAVIKSVSN